MTDCCEGSCNNCQEECGEHQGPQDPKDFLSKPHELSKIKKVIGVVSGKGGVGKSMVTSLMAVAMQRRGHQSAILDADITGPSIPRAFGLFRRAEMSELGLLPVKTESGIAVMSINLLMEKESAPVIWRGPVLGGTVKQFWTDVIWGDVDYMFIDMPPGTGDIPLTVFQSIELDGIIIVTSPQELVSMIVEKAVNMAKMMNVEILALVENMSYFKCPDCEKESYPFGHSRLEETAHRYGLKTTVRLPINTSLAEACDRGDIESQQFHYLDALADKLEKLPV